MPRQYCYLVLLLLCSCNSLPYQIAERCASIEKNCEDAAIRVADALLAVGYDDVRLCYGYVPGGRYHAWIEFVHDGEILVVDSNEIAGRAVFSVYDEEYRQFKKTEEIRKKRLPKDQFVCK